MSRPPSRLLAILALLALSLLIPSLATALPHDVTLRPAEHSAATPSLFAKFWDLLSAVWANGPGLEPNGTSSDANPEPGNGPDSSTTGDNGSGLEPNG